MRFSTSSDWQLQFATVKDANANALVVWTTSHPTKLNGDNHDKVLVWIQQRKNLHTLDAYQHTLSPEGLFHRLHGCCRYVQGCSQFSKSARSYRKKSNQKASQSYPTTYNNRATMSQPISMCYVYSVFWPPLFWGQVCCCRIRSDMSVLRLYCFDCFCMCSDDDVRGHECTTRCTSCRATLWAISTTCSLTELDRAVPHLHFISTSHPPVLGQVCYSQSSSCCAASIKWDQFCHEITLFPFAFDTPRGIWQVWVLQPKDKVVPFLQKWLHLYSCGEAFPGSRAFLQNTGELTWSQLNHAFDCLCFFLRSGWV